MDIYVSNDGWLNWTATDGHDHRVRCALGRGGVAEKRREGDGITPVGSFPLRRVWYRGDKTAFLVTGLDLRPIRETDGWCDDPASADYNRPVPLPHGASHEKMWRDDGLYDVVIEVGYNDDPVTAGAGSAIFLHIARPDYAPTEGCVAVAPGDMLKLLKDCDATTRLVIAGPRK